MTNIQSNFLYFTALENDFVNKKYEIKKYLSIHCSKSERTNRKHTRMNSEYDAEFDEFQTHVCFTKFRKNVKKCYMSYMIIVKTFFLNYHNYC